MNYCLFCGSGQDNKPWPGTFREFTKTSHGSGAYLKVERKDAFHLRTNQGDAKHNAEALAKGSTQIVTKNRQVAVYDLSLAECPGCLGAYSKKNIYNHKCPAKTDAVKVKGSKIGYSTLDDLNLEDCDDLVQDVIGGMIRLART